MSGISSANIKRKDKTIEITHGSIGNRPRYRTVVWILYIYTRESQMKTLKYLRFSCDSPSYIYMCVCVLCVCNHLEVSILKTIKSYSENREITV